MIGFDEAIELIRSAARPLEAETVSLSQAPGRVLAAPVIAQIDSPRTNVSAMDGYAVREEDLSRFPVRLRLAGESFAGSGWDGTLSAGSCARIFTGAPVPAGADRVVMQENVCRDDDVAIIDQRPGMARHVRMRGSDFRSGEQILQAGRLLDARAIVAAAGADVAEVKVFRRPDLHILSTGDELAEPGAARDRADAIPESVSFGVAALAEQWAGAAAKKARLRDNLAAMQSAAARAVDDADVIVVTGGASVGERDFAKAMFEPLGLELLFSKVSIKPGKPVWLGRVQDRFVVGLPGNPTSALVTARLFLVPLLSGLVGRAIESALSWRAIPLGSALRECGDRETFHRAREVRGKAEILNFQDSSAQKALAEADCLVRQCAGTPALAEGENVEVLDF